MDEDAFDRAVRREDEIRARVAAGEIDDDEAEALRALGARGDHEGLRLSLDQATRLVHEWIDVATLGALIRAWPRLTFDEAIDLISSYSIDRDAIEAFARAGVGPDIDAGTLEELWCNDIAPADLERVLRAQPSIGVEGAIRLAEEGIDADAIVRLREEGIDVDHLVEESRHRGDSWLSLLNVRLGSRRLLVGAGDATLTTSEPVTGVFVGDLRVAAGAEIELLGIIVGDVYVEPGGSFVAHGVVVGEVHHLAPEPV